MQYLISQIKVAFEIKGMPTQRTEIFEYPIAALREIILNSLIHRDYMSPVDVQIKIFDNRITFFNPGSLYGGLTLQELKGDNYQAYARNKLIAEAFYLTGDIEKYGSGFLRIRQEISTYPSMKLDFEELPRGFLVTLSYTDQKISTDVANVNEKVNENVHENVNEKLSNSQKRIVNAMQLDKWVTIEELSEAIGKYLRRGRKIIFSKYKCYSPRNSTNKFKSVKTYSFAILLLGPIEMQYLGIMKHFRPVRTQLR